MNRLDGADQAFSAQIFARAFQAFHHNHGVAENLPGLRSPLLTGKILGQGFAVHRYSFRLRPIVRGTACVIAARIPSRYFGINDLGRENESRGFTPLVNRGNRRVSNRPPRIKNACTGLAQALKSEMKNLMRWWLPLPSLRLLRPWPR